MKKFLSLILCAALVLALVPASLAVAEEGDNYVYIIGRNLGYARDDHNIILEEIEKRTGLDIHWELWPTDNYAQQCQLLFASGEYPDAMEVWWSNYPNQFIELIEDDLIKPLDDLLAEYAPNVLANRSEMAFYDYGDGQIWGVPCRVLESGTTYCITVRQDWLDKLGLPVPTNSQEYYDTLVAFQANAELLTGDPNAFCGHGSCTNYFWGTFVSYVFSEYGFHSGWNEVDGKMVRDLNMPGYKDAMATIRKFYQEGLIEPEFLLMNRDQFLDKLYTNAYGSWDYTIDLYDPAVCDWTKSYYESVPEAAGNMTMIAPFKDANGKAHMPNVNQTMQFVCFKDSERSENVMKLLNFLATEEGMLLTSYGLEGEHWEYDANGNPKSLLTDNEQKAEVGVDSYSWAFRMSYFNAAQSSEFDDEIALLATCVVPNPVMPATESYTDNKTAINNVFNTYRAELICNPDIDFDATYEKMVKEWHEVGGALWTEEINEYWASRQ